MTEENDVSIGRFEHIHVQQQQDWDCGIACFRMAQRWHGSDTFSPLESPYLQSFYEKCTPLWTIDIFVGLVESGLKDVSFMFTTTLGIAPLHRENSWYANHLDNDVERVDGQFRRAAQQGWNIRETKFDLMTFCSMTLSKQINMVAAIILICSNTLKAYPKKAEKYAGHYIFLIGYDPNTDEALYLDPSLFSSDVQRAPIITLDAAFSEPGTDHDIIVLSKMALKQWQ